MVVGTKPVSQSEYDRSREMPLAQDRAANEGQLEKMLRGYDRIHERLGLSRVLYKCVSWNGRALQRSDQQLYISS